MSITTAQYQMLRRDLTQVFNVAASKVVTVFDQFCTEIPSDGEFENLSWLGAMPNVREWVGPRQFNDLAGFDFIVRNKTWESSLLFNIDKLNDGKQSGMSIQTQDQAARAVQHMQKLWFETLMANPVCYDGQNFFDTDHSAGSSGNQSNAIDVTVVDRTNPTPLEMRKALHAGLESLLSFKDDKGEPFLELAGEPLGNLSVVCPYHIMYGPMNEAVTGALINSGGAAVQNILLDRPKVIPSVRVGSTFTGGDDHHFTLMYNGSVIRPFAFLKREPLKFQMKGMDDIEDNNLKAMTKARYGCGPFAWWFAVKVNLVNA